MQIFGGTRRLALGAFILAGLLLIGFNAAWLTRLLNPPLPVNSTAVKTAVAQWRAYQAAEERLARKAEVLGVMWASWPASEPRRENRPVELLAAPAPALAADDARLPAVNGILQIAEPGGSSRILALIGGRARGENDQVSGFTIERITVAGVAFGRDGRRWFAPAPVVPFSVDRGH
ncbi:MAG: hypothetical protein R6X05_03955 [Desulfobacterales bacterium]